MFWLHFVSNNISLYRDTSEAIYQYVYTLYRCNSTEQWNEVPESDQYTLIEQSVALKSILIFSVEFIIISKYLKPVL